ncbi:MAG: BspA family leucine-rich repeat surface protein, partial [bacterium]|nr:BspA family leucine-rich repeat surface protein [bacterium]
EESYIVKYNANKGTGNIEDSTFKQGENKKLNKNTFTREGYSFIGWSTSSKSNEVVYKDEEEVSNLTNVYNGVVNLYAVWEGNTYKIRYNSNEGTGEISNSTFKVGNINKLSKNIYTKKHYIFKGWSMTLNEEVKYSDEEEVKDLFPNENDIVDLYAVWEKEKYTVDVVVQNGTLLEGEVPSKRIEYNSNGSFKLYTSEEYYSGLVTCTNDQNGTFENNVLTVANVTSDTTCTVSYVTEKTTLYTDGTLIINEQLKNRNANIEKHGEVTNEYEPMSVNNSYVFACDYGVDEVTVNSPWFPEREQVKGVEIGGTIKPISTAYWISGFRNMVKGDFTNLDTSKVINMRGMFSNTSLNNKEFDLIGLNNWDTSKVTNMEEMFRGVGASASKFNLDLSGWDTSSVANMDSMFQDTGSFATTWSIGDISLWDTSSVTSMVSMFFNAGRDATEFNLYLSGWDTSSATNMSNMFRYAGSNATTWNIGDLSNWDTSKVTDMSYMFSYTGKKATTWSVGDLSGWVTSEVTNMSNMFSSAGYIATTWSVGDLSNWDTSKVTNMSNMFSSAGYRATTWSIGNLSGWDTGNVTDMSYMFSSAGQKATTFSLNLSSWDVSKVTNMTSMFSYAGYNSRTWSVLELSKWDTSKVTSMGGMFNNAGYNATTWNIGDISSWNTSNVTNMSYMFSNAGNNATIFNLDLSNWNISKVKMMSSMFFNAGKNATSWLVKIPSKTGILSNTTSKLYGSSSGVYAEPASGKYFTLS